MQHRTFGAVVFLIVILFMAARALAYASAPLQVAATPPAAGATPTTRPVGTPTASPTPAPAVFVLTKRDGMTIQLTSFNWSISSYYPSYEEHTPGGIPMASGVEVSTDYVTRVEFGTKTESSWPVTITLLDGTPLKDELGFKRAFGLRISGDTDLGSFQTSLEDVQTIVVERKSAPKTVPDAPPGGGAVVIETRRGTRTKVSGLKFDTRCVNGLRCCYGDTLSGIPLTTGLNADPGRIKAVQVGQVAEGKPVPEIGRAHV
jgi:hypothetical protein